MSLKKSILFIIFILLIDQVSKIYIKTHFVLGEDVTVFSWFKIYFIENDGMAWGTKISDFVSFISDRTAKISLTLFRVVAIFGIGYWLYSYGQVASFMPANGGYDGFLHGKVVDMLYFPLWKGYLPDWLPFYGGEYFTFFEPVFNVADMAISTGFGLLIVFNKRAFA